MFSLPPATAIFASSRRSDRDASVIAASEEQQALAGGRVGTARGSGGFGHTGRGGAGEGR